MQEGETVDIVAEVLGAEGAVNHCSVEDCRSAGWACKRSHFVAVEAEEWSAGVAVVSDSSSSCGLYFAMTGAIPCTVEASSGAVGTCHSAMEVRLMLQAVEGVGRNWHVACEVVSYAAAALTLLVLRLPRPRLHHRHHLHLFLESPKGPCAHVECHTTTISQATDPGIGLLT